MSDSFRCASRRRLLTPEQSMLPALPIFGIHSSNRAGLPLCSHIHSGCLEVVFLISGFQIYEVDGNLFSLSGNDIFVTYPDEPHSSGNFPQSISHIVWFQLDLSSSGPILGLDEIQSDFLREKFRNLPRLFRGSTVLKSDLTEAFCLLASGDSLSQALGRQLFVCCLYRILQLAGSLKLSQPESIADSIAYIHDHLFEKISLEDAAASCSLSLSHFKTKFKEETGSTPRTFINYLKIEQAKLLLKQHHSVTETALLLGFDTPNYFSATFRKYTGFTPGQYARQSS